MNDYSVILHFIAIRIKNEVWLRLNSRSELHCQLQRRSLQLSSPIMHSMLSLLCDEMRASFDIGAMTTWGISVRDHTTRDQHHSVTMRDVSPSFITQWQPAVYDTQLSHCGSSDHSQWHVVSATTALCMPWWPPAAARHYYRLHLDISAEFQHFRCISGHSAKYLAA